MNGISGISSSLHLAAGALNTHPTGMQVAAHNVANVSTDNFTPQREVYTDGPRGQGVALQAVLRDPKEQMGGQNFESQAAAGLNASDTWHLRPSGTELAKEMPHMITTQHAFAANAKTIVAADEMLGSLLNITT